MKKKQLLKKLHLSKKKSESRLDQFIRLLIVLGVLGLLLLLVYAAYINWPQRSVAEFLPAEQTVAYAEISDLKLQTRLQATTDGTKLVQSLGQPFGLDLMAAVDAFGRDNLALALVQDELGTNHSILFIQAKSQRAALKYFESLLLPGEVMESNGEQNPVYSYTRGQSFSFRFMERYAAISVSPEPLKLLSGASEGLSLTGDENFMKSVNNLPRRHWILGYLNFRKLSFRENQTMANVIEPLKHAIHHVAFTVRKDQQGFHFNTFLNMNKNLLSLSQGESKRKFSYELTDYILDDRIALYIGGANLEAEWQNTLETISNLNPAYGVILEGILRAQATKVFGSQVDLRNDLYPLFQGEYALAIGKPEGAKTVSLILSHKDRDFVTKKLEKLSDGFKFLAAKFAPKIMVVELPDGTESRELVPDEGRVEIAEENYEGYEVNCVEVSGTSSGFCYSVTDEIIIITNRKELLVDTINLDRSSELLSENVSFRKSLSNLSKVSDEITFVNFENFTTLMEANQYVQALKPILDKLEAGSWVKHYFTDGVSTEGYILVK